MKIVTALMTVSTIMTIRKPKCRKSPSRRHLHRHRTERSRKRDGAGRKGRHAEHHLQQQRQQKYQCAGAGAKQRTAGDADPKSGDPENRKVEQRMLAYATDAECQRAKAIPTTSRTTTDKNSPRPRPIASMPYMMQNSDAPVSMNPIQSSGRSVSSFGFSKNIVTSAMPIRPSGTLTQKIQRQEKYVVMKPPTGGPSTGPNCAGTCR